MLLAVGILGATVMPHVIWLHSALMQDRIRTQNEEQKRRLMRFTRIDVVIAMVIAGLINVAMLVMAASTFFKTGHHHVESLETAHKTLEPLLGGAASALFAIALVASGLSSSAVGTLAGQVVMQGFIRRQIPIVVRRAVTMAPAFVVIGLGANPSRTLILSQVILSFGIPVRPRAARVVHGPAGGHGRTRERPCDHGRGRRRCGRDHRPERVPARPDVRGLTAGQQPAAPGGGGRRRRETTSSKNQALRPGPVFLNYKE